MLVQVFYESDNLGASRVGANTTQVNIILEKNGYAKEWLSIAKHTFLLQIEGLNHFA